MQQPVDSHLNTPLGVAAFIATYTNELAQLARGQGLDTLGYIFEMAQFEAESLTPPIEPGATDTWLTPATPTRPP